MRIFGKERQSLLIRKISGSRALFVDGINGDQIEVRMLTDDGERLDLQIPHRLAPALIGELTDAYEAINPPLSRRNGGGAAGWDGMTQ